MSISPDFSAPDGEQMIDLSLLEPLIPILRQAQRKGSVASLRQKIAEQNQVIHRLKKDVTDLNHKLKQQTHAYLTHKAKSDRLTQDIQQKSEFIQQLQTQLLEQSTHASEPEIATLPGQYPIAQLDSLNGSTMDGSALNGSEEDPCLSPMADAWVPSLHDPMTAQAELIADQQQQIATLTQQLQQQEQETLVVRSHLLEQATLKAEEATLKANAQHHQIQQLQHRLQDQERAIAELQGRLAHQQSLSHIGEHHLNRWQTRTFSR